MKIDVSRETFSRSLDFTRVLLQQGQPILDSDWNEHTAITLDQVRILTRAIYGAHGGPAGKACGFVPFIKDGELWLRKGFYTVQGLLLDCERDYPYNKQKYYSDAAALPGPGRYLLYLEVVERMVTSATNPSLGEPALPGVDLAARAQLCWRVRFHSEDWSATVGSDVTSPGKGLVEQVASWMKEINPAPPPPSKKMDRLPKEKVNQLLRLERHSDDGVWKYSKNNAFALFKVVSMADHLVIELGNHSYWAPGNGSWIELLTHDQLHFDEPGILRRVTNAVLKDNPPLHPKKEMVLTLDEPVDVPSRSAAYARKWDNTMNFEAASDKDARPGDFWQCAARGSSQGEDWRYYRRMSYRAPLALVEVKETDSAPVIVSHLQRVVVVPWRDYDPKFES